MNTLQSSFTSFVDNLCIAESLRCPNQTDLLFLDRLSTIRLNLPVKASATLLSLLPG